MPRVPDIRDAHFPGRAPIDTYGNGGFRFADMSHRGSLLCLPSGIYGWSMEEGAPLDIEAFERVIAEAADFEFLLVGTGHTIRPLPAALKAAFRARGISADPMGTGAAIRTYNIMLGEQRPVAAALIAV
ncbi:MULTISPECIES: Mth938-like domain-containing protein [unclassified Rhizobium]|uniref:Mth938-like domain-containing protein n=1 Tax=unclassified Rhizobium TaxID=2613769 RepID=UPI003D297691